MEVDDDGRSTPLSPAAHLATLESDAQRILLSVMAPFIGADMHRSYRWWQESLFPWIWKSASTASERGAMTTVRAQCIAKPYHAAQAHLRPNVVQAMLGGLARVVCKEQSAGINGIGREDVADGMETESKTVRMPPQLVRWAATTYNAWYEGMLLLEGLLSSIVPNPMAGKSKRGRVQVDGEGRERKRSAGPDGTAMGTDQGKSFCTWAVSRTPSCMGILDDQLTLRCLNSPPHPVTMM
jgi:hypothetical protein